MDGEEANYLDEWAIRERRRTKNELAEVLLGRAIEKDKLGIEVNVVTLSEDHFSQIQKYLALLAGKHPREGISFAVIEKALGISKEELNELYLLVDAFRGVPNLPSGYKWKIVKEEVDLD